MGFRDGLILWCQYFGRRWREGWMEGRLNVGGGDDGDPLGAYKCRNEAFHDCWRRLLVFLRA